MQLFGTGVCGCVDRYRYRCGCPNPNDALRCSYQPGPDQEGIGRRRSRGAQAEAHKNSWNVVIAILDSGGHLVLLQRLDNTQFASVEVAQQKAYSAVAFRLPTKVFQDGVAAGGAIGISGVTSQQDNQIAKAGAGALK